MKKIWRLWAKALGEKDGRTDREADIIAGIRTFILISYMVTNGFIISGVMRHWENRPPENKNEGCSVYNNRVNKQGNVHHN